MSKSAPFIAVGHGELDNNPDVFAFEVCDRCGKKHKVVEALDVDGVPSRLYFYTCKTKKPHATYICGIGGKRWVPPARKRKD